MKHNIPVIKEMLSQSRVFGESEIYYFQEVNSTNSWLAERNNVHGKVCIAEQQTSGKGRLGRHWVSAESSSILLSFGYQLGDRSAYGLSLVSGLAVLEAMQLHGIEGLTLKWPNDVLLNSNKVAGILVEISGPNTIVGIGVNVDMPSGSMKSIEQPWTDLCSNGYKIDRDSLTADILLQHEAMFSSFLHHGFKDFADLWSQFDEFNGKKICANFQMEKISGTAAGVNEKGEYLLNLEDQTQIAINSGEIIWRGNGI